MGWKFLLERNKEYIEKNVENRPQDADRGLMEQPDREETILIMN